MGEDEIMEYKRERMRGVVMEEGEEKRNVVIVEREMGIKVVGKEKGVV